MPKTPDLFKEVRLVNVKTGKECTMTEYGYKQLMSMPEKSADWVRQEQLPPAGDNSNQLNMPIRHVAPAVVKTVKPVSNAVLAMNKARKDKAEAARAEKEPEIVNQ